MHHADTGTPSNQACIQSSQGHLASAIMSTVHDHIYQCDWKLKRPRSSPFAACWWSSAVTSHKQRCSNQHVTSRSRAQGLPRIHCPVTCWCGGVDVVGRSLPRRPLRRAGRGSIRRNDNSQNTNMVAGIHELQGWVVAAYQRDVLLRASPKQLSLSRDHLQTALCHPAANVHYALAEVNCGGSYVMLTMHVELWVVGVTSCWCIEQNW